MIVAAVAIALLPLLWVAIGLVVACGALVTAGAKPGRSGDCRRDWLPQGG